MAFADEARGVMGRRPCVEVLLIIQTEMHGAELEETS